MTQSFKLRFFSLLLTNILGLHLHADTLTLSQESKLTGTIQSIDSLQEQGLVTLQHQSTPSPMVIRAEHVKQILFSPSLSPLTQHTECLTLHTGEKLPCQIIQLNSNTLKINTSYAGQLELKKSDVAKITFQSSLANHIYYGPNSSKEWSYINDWIYQGGSLISKSKSLAYRNFELPESFIVSFRLHWEEHPKFKFYFCTESKETMKKQNRYMLFFDASGIELKRVTRRRYQGLAAIQRRPDSFKNNTTLIQLKVDRKNGQISISLDGEEIGTFIDKTSNIPSGNGFIFESTPRSNGSLELSDITISPWDGITALSKPQQNTNKTLDSFYDNQGQLFSGQALNLERKEDKNLHLTFKSPHTSQPMEIEAANLNSLFFPTPEEETPKQTIPPIYIELSPSGEMFASDISLKDGLLTATHPSLGTITLKQSTINSVLHNDSQPSLSQP